MADGRAKGRMQLLLVGVVFMGPLLTAYYLYFNSGWAPGSSTEHGDLLQPPVLLPDTALVDDGAASAPSFLGKWSLIVFDDGACAEPCMRALYATRQVRRRLGRDGSRVQRLLHSAAGHPDAQFLDREHPGLIVLDTDSAAGEVLERAAGNYRSGDIFLSDPLGNLILRFPAGTSMEDMHEDLKKLLKISHIG